MARIRKGKLITVEIDIPLYQRIRQLSRDTGVSISFKLREALLVWCDSPAEAKSRNISEMIYDPHADFGA